MKVNIIITDADTNISTQAAADVVALVFVGETRFPVVFYNELYSVIESKSGMTLGGTHWSIGDAVDKGRIHILKNWNVYLKKISTIKNNINPEWK